MWPLVVRVLDWPAARPRSCSTTRSRCFPSLAASDFVVNTAKVFFGSVTEAFVLKCAVPHKSAALPDAGFRGVQADECP